MFTKISHINLSMKLNKYIALYVVMSHSFRLYSILTTCSCYQYFQTKFCILAVYLCVLCKATLAKKLEMKWLHITSIKASNIIVQGAKVFIILRVLLHKTSIELTYSRHP